MNSDEIIWAALRQNWIKSLFLKLLLKFPFFHFLSVININYGFYSFAQSKEKRTERLQRHHSPFIGQTIKIKRKSSNFIIRTLGYQRSSLTRYSFWSQLEEGSLHHSQIATVSRRSSGSLCFKRLFSLGLRLEAAFRRYY